MERVFSPDDRIKRAEEIYARRKLLRERTKKATVNVADKRNFKLLKKITLQIVISILIYCTFYLINTTSYSFSENTIEKIKELLSHDFDFYSAYNSVIQNINNYLYSDENEQEENIEDETDNEESEVNEENIENEEESLTQNEISSTEESETERIRNNYSFLLPVSGTVSSEYGTREVTASVVTAYHKGIDIGADTGTPIYASTNGEVIISKYSSSYGNYIMIQNDEVKTVYAHCSELLVNVRR